MAKSLPGYAQDQTYAFSYLRMGQLGYNAPGVVLLNDMFVSPGSGLQVEITAGEAYVQQTVSRLGTFYASRGVYQIFDDSTDQPYNSVAAPTSFPRVDQVIARVYDVYEQELSGSSYWRYEWLEGTETSGATLTNLDGAASLPANSLRLAYCLATTAMSSWSDENIENIGPRSTSVFLAGPQLAPSSATIVSIGTGSGWGCMSGGALGPITIPGSGRLFVRYVGGGIWNDTTSLIAVSAGVSTSSSVNPVAAQTTYVGELPTDDVYFPYETNVLFTGLTPGASETFYPWAYASGSASWYSNPGAVSSAGLMGYALTA